MSFRWFVGVGLALCVACGDDDGAPNIDHDAGVHDTGVPAEDAAIVGAVVDGGSDAASPIVPSCNLACDRVLDCATETCVGIDWRTARLAQDRCDDACAPSFIGDVMSASDCDGVMTAVSTAAPALDALCHGSTGCADMTACTTFADKATGCIVDHCDGNADPYQAGVQQVLLDYCANADDCPAPETIALLNGDSITCDDPPLDAYGPAAPFTAICAGTVGAAYADVLAACDTLITCGAAFASEELCAAFLTFEAGASTKVTCIDVAADCTEAFACL